ncbi:Putative secreted protein [Actinomycetales bacterium JB111]|nr:Putative secreted protein [Actinomycetales bacterium JB111]
MSPRTSTRVLGAAAGAVVVLALTGGALAIGGATPAPVGGSDAARTVQLPAGDVTEVCAPGPVPTTESTGPADPDADLGDETVRANSLMLTWPADDDAGPAARASFAAGAGAEEPTPLAAGSDGEASSLSAGLSTPGVLTIDPVGDTVGTGGGAVVARTDAGDLRGLAAATCVAPGAATWLVGGSTELGSTARLTLTNPGPVPVSVDATVHTELGVQDAPALTDVVVPPRSSVDLPVEASVQAASLALRIQSDGGQVAASLQDLRTQGLTSDGLDIVSPSAGPAPEQTIAGVEIADGAASAVRIVNPSDDVVTAAIDVATADGWSALSGAEDVVLDPGVALDVPLTGIEPGVHGFRIRASDPVTAAALTAHAGTSEEGTGDVATEIAWTPATLAAASAEYVIPGSDLGLDATLALTNPTDRDQIVALTDLDGALTLDPVTVPAGGTAAVALPDGVRAVRAVAEPADASGAGGESPSAESPSGESPSAVQDMWSTEAPSAESPSGESGTEDATTADDRESEAPASGVVGILLLGADAPTGRLVATLAAVPDARLAGQVSVRLDQ